MKTKLLRLAQPKAMTGVEAYLEPLGARLLVRPLETRVEDAMTKSGIVLPGEAIKITRAEVVRVGSGTVINNGQMFPVEADPGDWVFYRNVAGMPIYGGGLVLVEESSILARVRKANIPAIEVSEAAPVGD